MKKIVFVILSLFILCNISLAQSSKFQLSVDGGISIPTSDFELTHSIGFNVTGNLGFNINKLMGIRADVQYNSLPFKKYTGIQGVITGDPYIIISASADFLLGDFKKISNVGNLIPYGFAGPTLYFLESGDETLTFDNPYYAPVTTKGESTTKFGINIGGGAIYKLSKSTGIFGEVTYNYTLGGSQINYVPIKVGLFFNI